MDNYNCKKDVVMMSQHKEVAFIKNKDYKVEESNEKGVYFFNEEGILHHIDWQYLSIHFNKI